MSETWVKEWCAKCDAINWLCIGRTDIDALKCRKCSHIEFFGDAEDFEMMKEISGWESIDDCFWEVGLETPNL